MEIGNTFSVSEVMFHSLVKYGVALLGSELPIVELMTVVMVVNTTNPFFLCNSNQNVSVKSTKSCSDLLLTLLQLYGFSASFGSHATIFLSSSKDDEPALQSSVTLLSAASSRYLDLASWASMLLIASINLFSSVCMSVKKCQ